MQDLTKARKVSFGSRILKYKEAYIMLLPFFLLFLIFNVVPVIANFVFSFTYFSGLSLPSWVGFDNYIRLFTEDDIFLIAVRNTIVFAIITGPVSYLLCFMFAWFINELGPRIRAVLTVVFYAPSITGSVYIIWKLIFSGDAYGFLNSFLLNMGYGEPVQWLTNKTYILPIIILVQLWLSLGTGFLAFIAGFKGLDRSYFEAGAVDGIKNRFQELWYITLPQMIPILILGAVLQITAAFSVGDVAVNLAGFPSTDYAGHTMMIHMRDHGITRYDIGYAATIGTILSFVMIATNKFIQSKLQKVGR